MTCTGNSINRNGTADLLKGFAVLFMIQVHIMEQFATPDTFNSTIGRISLFFGGPLCAPVFMAVMGYFLAKSSRPMAYFLKRGVLLFLGGILLNTARSANLLVGISNGEFKLDPWFFIMGADILTLAGLSLMMTGILRMAFRDKAVFYFLLALVVAAVSPFLDNVISKERISGYFIAFLWGTEEWSYFPLFPWYSYVLTGYAFFLFLKQIPFAKKIDIQNHFVYFVPLWVLILFTLPYASGISANLYGSGGYYHHGILYFGWVLLFMISYLVVMKLIEIKYGDRPVVRTVKWIGKEVTIIYVIQWLIIGNIATIIFRTQDLFQITTWFLVITLATILLGLLFVRIRNAVR